MSRRIVLTTFGSLGDLHPYLAFAIGLKERGHQVVLATHETYRDRIESEGIAFRPVRPDLGDMGDEREFSKRAFDLRSGPEFLIRHGVVAPIRNTFADLDAAVGDDTDLLITHPITFAGRIVAEKRGIPWLSGTLAPTSMFSAYDPPLIAPAPIVTALLRRSRPKMATFLIRAIKRQLYPWTEPVRQFRGEIGLPPAQYDPLFDGQFSPHGTVALYSSVLGAAQPDWPAWSVQTGFLFYDRHSAASALAPEIEAFLAAGEPPIVFTLGSAAVMSAGEFYRVSAEAAIRLRRRAILLIGRDERNISATPLPDSLLAHPYAPYSQLFPHAAAVVHQGGVGTTAQALRAGRPQLIVPYGFDQPDNADRIARLGTGRTLARVHYSVESVVRELGSLLANPSYAQTAHRVGERIRDEDGVGVACDAVEALFERAK